MTIIFELLLDANMPRFDDLLKLKDYYGLFDYCEDKLNKLCSAIKENDRKELEDILHSLIEDSNKIHERIDLNLRPDHLKLLVDLIKKENYLVEIHQNIRKNEKNAEDIIRQSIEEYWIFCSIYSFMYSIYNIGNNLQSIVYDTTIYMNMESDEALYLSDIYSRGYIYRNSIPKDILDRLLMKEVCSIDEKERVFLTNMGLTLNRMEGGDRIRNIALNQLLEEKLCSSDKKDRVFLSNLGLTLNKMSERHHIRDIALNKILENIPFFKENLFQCLNQELKEYLGEPKPDEFVDKNILILDEIQKGLEKNFDRI